MHRIFFISTFLLLAFTCGAKVFDFVVDPNGNGDYTTIQEAFNAVPDDQNGRTLIFVKAGTYTEKLVVPSSKNKISLIGEDVDRVIFTWNDHAGMDGLSSAETYTLMVEAADFYMENITVQNTAGNVGQALAIRTVGDKGIYNNCRFLGFQDTYYAHKNRQFNFRCYVEGATDFIYGDATAVFDQCIVNCLNGGQYITAPSDTKMLTQFTSGNTFYHGLVLRECKITANADVNKNSYYLGRPWQPKASAVYLQCTMGDHIKPIGWSTWSGNNNHESGYYAEYLSVDETGNPIDVSQRAVWSQQVTDAWFNNFYKYAFFFRKDKIDWDPVEPTMALPTPVNLRVEEGILRWDIVEQAVGYVVKVADTLYAITETNQLELKDLDSDQISIHSVRDNGVLSTPDNDNVISTVAKSVYKTLNPQFKNFVLSASQELALEVYSIDGKRFYREEFKPYHDLAQLEAGYYILRFMNREGVSGTMKIVR